MPATQGQRWLAKLKAGINACQNAVELQSPSLRIQMAGNSINLLHKGKKGAKALAGLDYQQKMAEIFAECRCVLKDDGVMTLMFTHKATGAWDALTKGLIDAGFAITASWPINTEAEGSLHIKDKSAANSTIFLVCRPRPEQNSEDGVQYWEDLEPRVKAAVRQRIEQFQAGGIRGVDLYLSCFGPALEEFSLHWPTSAASPNPSKKKPRSVAVLSSPSMNCSRKTTPTPSPLKTLLMLLAVR